MLRKSGLSAVLALAIAASAGSAAAESNGKRPRAAADLEGSWQTTITPYNCVTGVPNTPATFDSYLTFAAGGTLVETTSNPSFLPGQRSAGHGFWERAGHQSYDASFQAFVQFAGGSLPQPQYVRGVQRVDIAIDMDDGADHWSGVFTVTFRNTAGAVVPPSGCARAVAVRIE
jgi:hypothetical protein